MKYQPPSYAPSRDQIVPHFNGAGRKFDFAQDIEHVVLIEQQRALHTGMGSTWPMNVVLHRDDGTKIAWTDGNHYGTAEKFALLHADQIEAASPKIKNIPVTGEDGFSRPLFPAAINHTRTLAECVEAARHQKELDIAADAAMDPKAWNHPRHRSPGLRRDDAKESYGGGERLMHGANLAVNAPSFTDEVELKQG